MTVIATDSTAVKMAEDIRTTGGSSRSVVPGVPTPKTGYMVSLKGYEETFSLWSDETLADYIERHRHQLAMPGRYVGAWMHNGLLYLDVSIQWATLSAAYYNARQNEQLAFYDVANGTDVPVEHVQPFPTAA